jgi:outer membrane protein assembly factor BamA
MESSEAPVAAVGGLRSLRGYPDARFLGAKKLIGGIEARYALVWKPTLFELKIGAFFDVGRVFGAEPFRLTTDGLHHGGGVQVGGRFLRNTVVLLGIAFGTEGTVPFFAGEWAF